MYVSTSYMYKHVLCTLCVVVYFVNVKALYSMCTVHPVFVVSECVLPT